MHRTYVLVALGVCACTQSNPAFVDEQGTGGDAAWLDQSMAVDGGKRDGRRDGAVDLPTAPDIKPAWDTVPWPDTVPWDCVGDVDCDDKRSCTVDSCTAAKTCANTLKPGTCLIGGACFAAGDLAPTNSCAACQPAVDPGSWTPLKDGTTCDPDTLGCTQDVCSAGSCTHPLIAGACLIDGTCRGAGDANPSNSCQTCQPPVSQVLWSTAPDGTPCTADGLSCTKDQCVQGACTHPVNPGWCAIGNVCYQDGKSSASDVCNECVPSESQTVWTFVDGKPCSTGPGVARMCQGSQCRGWVETLYEPPASQSPGATELNSVDHISSAGGVWAVGQFTSSNVTAPGGLLVPLDTPASAVVTKAPLNGIHYRMAVGAQAQAWYHGGNGWTNNNVISAYLKGSERKAVHGMPGLASEVFHLAGAHDSSFGGVSGVLRCTMIGPVVTCSNQNGFASDAVLGGVFATSSAIGTVGTTWAVNTEVAGDEDEDIYASSGSGPFSRNPPLGCEDGGSTPCSSTSGAFRDMYGASASDVWVVGSYGNLLHFDGNKWVRLTNAFSYQTYYVLNAVYASPADKLVTIATYRATSSTRWVSIVNHNTALDRWYGPVTVLAGPNNDIDEIRDIGGKGYTDLWMVGRREVTLPSGKFKTQGWILHLQ